MTVRCRSHVCFLGVQYVVLDFPRRRLSMYNSEGDADEGKALYHFDFRWALLLLAILLRPLPCQPVCAPPPAAKSITCAHCSLASMRTTGSSPRTHCG